MATLIIDVRSRDEFAREYIPGSRNIPLEEVSDSIETLREEIWQNDDVILTCRSGRRAQEAASLLKARGYDIRVMDGGLTGWKKSGGEVLLGKGGISVMRQVQIVIGAMLLLGFFVEPLWFLVPFAGAGLIFAGLTGTCGMAMLLAKLPWNRLDTPVACAVKQ